MSIASNTNLRIFGNRMREVIASNSPIISAVKELIEQSLEFRIDKDSLIIRDWQNVKVQFEDYLRKLNLGKAKAEHEPRFGVVYENSRFALNCQRNVANLITEHSLVNWKEVIEGMEGHTCREIIVSIADVLKMDKDSKLSLNLIESFLLTEFSILGVLIVREDTSGITNNVVYRLEYLIALAAQDYLGAAIEMGYIRNKNIDLEPLIDTEFDEHFLKEQKYLAECGLKDYCRLLE